MKLSGGAPHDMLIFHDADLSLPHHGLRGCILSFVLAEAERSLFGAAVTGQVEGQAVLGVTVCNIMSCRTLLSATPPCAPPCPATTAACATR